MFDSDKTGIKFYIPFKNRLKIMNQKVEIQNLIFTSGLYYTK